MLAHVVVVIVVVIHAWLGGCEACEEDAACSMWRIPREQTTGSPLRPRMGDVVQRLGHTKPSRVDPGGLPSALEGSDQTSLPGGVPGLGTHETEGTGMAGSQVVFAWPSQTLHASWIGRHAHGQGVRLGTSRREKRFQTGRR